MVGAVDPRLSAEADILRFARAEGLEPTTDGFGDRYSSS